MSFHLPPRARVLVAVCLSLFSIGLLASTASAACDRVASRAGADTNAGTETAPFKTAQKLADSLAAGETGCLRGGTYDDQWGGGYVLKTLKAGITIQSYPGERARLVGLVFVPKETPNVTLRDLDLVGIAPAGATSVPVSIKLYAADTVFEGNDVTNHGIKTCVILGNNNGWGQALRTKIRRNRFHGCGAEANGNQDHAIYLENSADAEISDNLIWDSSAWAIHLYPNAQNTHVHHNVFDGNGYGVTFSGDSTRASNGNVVERNVISNSEDGYNVQSWWGGSVGAGNVARDNCVFNGRQGNVMTPSGYTASGNLVADPRYVDRAAADFRLRSDSPCLALLGYDVAARLAGEPTPPPPVTSEPTAAATSPTTTTTSPATASEPTTASTTTTGQPSPAPVPAPAPTTTTTSTTTTSTTATAVRGTRAKKRKPRASVSSRRAAIKRRSARRRAAQRRSALRRAAHRRAALRRAAARRH